MTTIAATMKVMAGDAMVSAESKGIWYPTRKIRRISGGIVGAAGDGGDCTRFMDWAAAGFAERKRPKFTEAPGSEDEAILLLLNADGIHCMSTSDPFPELVAMDFFAIGSGGKAALAALYAGVDLEKAMDIAHAVDPYTRPPFTYEKL